MERREFLDKASKIAAAATALGIGFPGLEPKPSVERGKIIDEIHRHIAERKDQHIAKLQEFLHQPSISSENVGVKECAELLRRYFVALGCKEAELVPTDRHPGVFAYYDAKAPQTLVNYMMYDVQPVNAEDWSSPPFDARVVDKPPLGRAIIARGAINTKGPLRAFLNALESIIAVNGTLPFNMYFLCEGEEELGSLHYPQIVARYKDRIKNAVAVLYATAEQNAEGDVVMFLGNKGIVYLELECTGKQWGRGPTEFEIHGSNQAIVDSPVWRLNKALSTMVSEDGNRVLIEGWYDKVAPPRKEDLELVEALEKRFDENVWKKAYKVEKWVGDLHGRDLIMRYLYTNTLNIDGIWAGYTVPGGVKTILPHMATAKLDSRLIPEIESKDIIPLIRKHLDRHGYTDIEIKKISAYEWSKTSPNEPIIQAIVDVYKKRGIDPMIWPHAGGSAPFYIFQRDGLSLPVARFGLGHGARAHSVDEYYIVEGNGKIAGLVEAEQAYVDVLFALAERLRK